ncbi:YheC/YheD family protein [Oceaniferula spumae]|uniref:YheC/YheD family protein n=1 Tax=Oceaniferula spumae TaxID=2979115 RepID=UPI003F4F216F
MRDLYRDLRWTFRAKRSSFESADFAFIQKDHYDEWQARRKKSHSAVALSQLPHVSSLLVAKAPLAEMVEGRPYAPETYIDACEGQKHGIWVQKPSVGGRGSDIEFLRDPCDWQKSGYVLQRYLDTPYLVEGRKFDVRVLAKINDQGELRVHPEGLIRCANQAFDTSSLDPRIHNSNVTFQQREKVTQGVNTLLSRLPLAESALKQIGDIVADIQRLLLERDVFHGTNDFEMLGFDFLINDEEKVLLLEINQHPGWHSYNVDTGHFYLDAIDSLFD